jgi:hypothetical protein
MEVSNLFSSNELLTSRNFYFQNILDFKDFGLRYSNKKRKSIVLIDPKGRLKKGYCKTLI